MHFEGKVCIVTGAGSGLGAALTGRLVEAGAKVVLAGRREDKLREVAARCGAPDRTLVLPTDVTRLAQVRRLLARTSEAFGALHVVISNAGVSYGGPPGEISPAETLHLMKTNCIGPMWLITLALPELRKHPDSAVVATLSLAGLVAMPGQSGYCASKFALRGFLEALRRDSLGGPPRYLRVFPGGMDTEMNTPAMRRHIARLGAEMKVYQPDRVARRILRALRSDRAGKLVVSPAPDRYIPTVAASAPRLFDAQVKKMAPVVNAFMCSGNEWARARNTPDEVE